MRGMELKEVLRMNKKIKQIGSDKKAKKDKKIIKVILWTVIIFIIGQISVVVCDWTIVDPFLQQITPPKVTIEPYPFPHLHDGKQWIRVNIHNKGLSDVDPINVEYKLCNMDRFERGKLHSNTLKKDDRDYFEVESNLNTNCSIITEPVIVKLYKDTEGEYYVQSTKSVSNVCKYCEMDIKVFEGNDKIEELSYPYPFFVGELYGETLEVGEKYKSYEEAENASELIYEGDIEIFLLDPSHGCLRGDYPFTREWCEENGYPTY